MAQPSKASLWEVEQPSSDWEVEPNAGLAPPSSPGIPPALRPTTPSLVEAAGIRDPQERGTVLKQRIMEDAAPYVQSAQIVGGAGPGPSQLATTVRGVGKAAGLAEKFMPWSRLSRAGEAIQDVSGSLAKRVAQSAPTLPETPLPVQASRVAERFGSPTSGRPSGMRPPREPLIKQMGGRPVEDISDAAVKEQMEQSPEVTYGKYAKRHAGQGSQTYPEPAQWQDQPPENAPWGGTFYRR